jgi:hypothetical protein
MIGLQEVAPLKSELSVFRDRISKMDLISPELREHLSSADLRIDPVHLAGSREHLFATWWMNIPWLRIYFLASRQAKDREIVDAELMKVRDRIQDLYKLVEVTYKNA